jgi:glucose dehydrogenase
MSANGMLTGVVVTSLALLAVSFVSVPRPGEVARGEWPVYAGDLGAKKYSALAQIDQSNVQHLQIAWEQSAAPLETREGRVYPTSSFNYERTPLMVGGLLYISTTIGTIAALEPTTGKVVWFEPPPSFEQPQRGGANRGLAYWTDGKDSRVLTVSGRYLVALDAKTGRPKHRFGQDGQVDLGQGAGRPLVGGFPWNSPPIVVRNVVVVGGVPVPAADVSNGNQRPSGEAPPGDVRGYDVRSGTLLWTFPVVPRSGELGRSTWLNDSAVTSGNAGTWTWMSADEELGYVYLPLDEAAAETLVCLDAATGKPIWHFQGVHDGIRDDDVPTAPVLLDLTVNGRQIKAVAQVSKQAFVYVFDRTSGMPIWPIEDGPVPRGNVPGQWYPPAQPVPPGLPVFDQQGMTVDDLIDFTPELRREAVTIINQYHYGPLYTPATTGKPKIVMPGTVGGANWNGAGADPEAGILYVPTIRLPVIVELVKSKDPQSVGSWVRKDRGSSTNLQLPNGLPIVKPPYGSLVAVDLNKGGILWKVVNGNGPRNHPALKGLNLPPLGTLGRPSPLVTKTLLFLGEGAAGTPRISPTIGGGRMFRAYDKLTGEVVWEMELPGGTTGAPMTYLAGGKQYIVVAVGWPGMQPELVALALP